MTALFLYTELMIRILFLLVTFISFSAKADMDQICFVTSNDYDAITTTEVIEVIEQSKCDRNNILTVYALAEKEIINVIDKFCRYDREINYMQRGSGLLGEKYTNTYGLTCVLYSRKGREVRNILSSQVKD